MYANSRDIRSAQEGPHEKLLQLLTRQHGQAFRKPVAPWNQAAFECALRAWGGQSPLILDAGCGVGWSSLHLARTYPDHFVLGVDQSQDRILRGKPGEMPPNLHFVRADLVDFWRLLHAAEVRLARHFILYPNPWPKIGQLSRRWHAHPVFPTVLALGGVLESRSNWRIYLEEMALALDFLLGVQAGVETWVPVHAQTPFERKYQDSGQPLFRLCADLDCR